LDNIKNDSYYLGKIRDDLKFVIDQTNGISIDELQSNQLLIDSIMFRIIQIAENNGKLSENFKLEHKNVPWKAIKGMRNRIVHDYGDVDLTFVYDTVINGMPAMYKEILNMDSESQDKNG